MKLSDMEITVDREEIITPWVKSSYSNSGANCIELACRRDGAVAVRDSQGPDGSLLAFSPQRWAAFTRQIRKRAPAQAAWRQAPARAT
jgi:Domain of unknown function (DUF397)